MILIDKDIEFLALTQNLVVPFDRGLLNPASLDIRIGRNMLLATDHGWVKVDLNNLTKDEPFYLHPNDFVLVESIEVFNFPDNVAGNFRLKSSRGREGFDHGAAGWIDPLWSNSRLTMEIKAIHPFDRLPLYYGQRIGQIVFYLLNGVPELDYSQVGHYNNDLSVKESKI